MPTRLILSTTANSSQIPNSKEQRASRIVSVEISARTVLHSRRKSNVWRGIQFTIIFFFMSRGKRKKRRKRYERTVVAIVKNVPGGSGNFYGWKRSSYFFLPLSLSLCFFLLPFGFVSRRVYTRVCIESVTRVARCVSGSTGRTYTPTPR